MNNMNQIKLNGLLWDVENLEIDGKTHFTFDEAQEAAKSVGKRLPTVEELGELAKLWTRWDNERGGRSFRDNDENEVFFPAAGYRFNSGGTLYSTGSSGYYWSSSANSTSSGYYLTFNSGYAYRNSNYRTFGFSVRCVQDIE